MQREENRKTTLVRFPCSFFHFSFVSFVILMCHGYRCKRVCLFFHQCCSAGLLFAVLSAGWDLIGLGLWARSTECVSCSRSGSGSFISPVCICLLCFSIISSAHALSRNCMVSVYILSCCISVCLYLSSVSSILLLYLSVCPFVCFASRSHRGLCPGLLGLSVLSWTPPDGFICLGGS